MIRKNLVAMIVGILIVIPTISIAQALDDVRTDEEEETVIEVWTDEESYSSEKPIIVFVKNVGNEDITINTIKIERLDKDPKPIKPEGPLYPPEPTRAPYPPEPARPDSDDPQWVWDEYYREREEWSYECERIDYEYKRDYERWEYECDKIWEEYVNSPEYQEYLRYLNELEEWEHMNLPYNLSQSESLGVGEEKSYTCWESRGDEYRGYWYRVGVNINWAVREKMTLLEWLGLSPSSDWPPSWVPHPFEWMWLLFAAVLDLLLLPLTLLGILEYYLGGGIRTTAYEGVTYTDFYLE